LVIGGGNTGRFETTCAKLSKAIYTKQVVTATQAFQELREAYPPDDDFQANFRSKQERNTPKLQYFLKALEREEQRLARGVMAGEWDITSPTVEHVLPKNPGSDWDDVMQEDPTIVEDCA
jgi:hypothetical protein